MTLIDAEPAAASKPGLFPLRMAFADYDRTRPLLHGLVRPEGIALDAEAKWVGDFCHRPVYEEYDAAEMSLSWYVAARERGEPCVALPIFPLRDPLLAYAYARTDSPFEKPADLKGGRVGVHGYRYTINAWLRGVFADHYGLSPEDVTWVTCEPEGAGYVAPTNLRIELQSAKTATQLLRDGDVDALLAPRVPKEFQQRQGWIRRLFPDARGETHRLARRLGFIPVSHVIVMNERLARREPWIAASLCDAFVAAQHYADEIWRTEKMTSFVNSMFHLEEQIANYGDDSFKHGLTPANRANIETFTRYAREQGYISRELSIDELFLDPASGR